MSKYNDIYRPTLRQQLGLDPDPFVRGFDGAVLGTKEIRDALLGPDITQHNKTAPDSNPKPSPAMASGDEKEMSKVFDSKSSKKQPDQRNPIKLSNDDGLKSWSRG